MSNALTVVPSCIGDGVHVYRLGEAQSAILIGLTTVGLLVVVSQIVAFVHFVSRRRNRS